MFANRQAAEEKAAAVVHEKGRHLGVMERERMRQRLADQLEKKSDDWTRKNVGLD